MNLTTQVLSLLFSFGYGYAVYILINRQRKYLLNKDKRKRIIFTTFFFIDIGLLYFLGMRVINEGIINWIFILVVFGGTTFKKYVK